MSCVSRCLIDVGRMTIGLIAATIIALCAWEFYCSSAAAGRAKAPLRRARHHRRVDRLLWWARFAWPTLQLIHPWL